MPIAFIAQGAKRGTASGVTTDAADTTGADLIVLAAAYYPGSSITISDSKSNTWTALTLYGGTTAKVRLYYCSAPSAGSSHTFTASGTAIYSALGYVAVSGAGAYHSENGATGSSGTSVQPGSVTPPEDGCLVVTAIGMDAGNAPGGEAATDSIACNSGFTATGLRYISGASEAIGIARLIQTTAAAINPTWSWASQVNNIAAAIAVFRPASAGGLAGPLLRGRLTSGGILRGRIIRG
jgi:hypothetical protein